jgi:hypothetical protein
MCIGYWWESQKERDHWEDNIKMDLREIEWNGIDWNYLAPGFHKMLGNSWVAAELAAPTEGLSSMSIPGLITLLAKE